MKPWLKIFFITALFLTGNFLVYLLSPNYLANILIVYFLPVALNFFWLKKTKIKILVFAIITTIFFALPIELLSRLANSWDVQSVLPRLWGIVPVENLLYAFINFLWVLSFYEYFVDKESRPRFSRRAWWLLGLYVCLFAVVMSYFFFNTNASGFNYWLIGLLVLFVPSFLIYSRKPELLNKTWLPTIFFALVFFGHEFISLKLGHWWWPGEYLWPVELAGQIFPLDDVIVWYLLSTPALIGGYEFFVDDYK